MISLWGQIGYSYGFLNKKEDGVAALQILNYSDVELRWLLGSFLEEKLALLGSDSFGLTALQSQIEQGNYDPEATRHHILRCQEMHTRARQALNL